MRTEKRTSVKELIAVAGLTLFASVASIALPTDISRQIFYPAQTLQSLAEGFLSTAAQAEAPAEPASVLATETWTGGDNNDPNWTSNGNWSGVGGAGAGDSLIFPQSASRKANTNNFAVNTAFNSLDFTGGGYTVSGSQIFLDNGIDVNIPPGSGAAPDINFNIILGNSQTWNFQTGNTRIDGVVNFNNRDLTVITSGSGTSFNGPLNGTGSMLKAGTGTLFVTDVGNGFGTTEINNGTIDVVGPTGSLGNILLSGGGNGIIRGDGTVGSIAGAGTISPGQASGTRTGILTATGNVTLLGSPGNTFEIQIDGPTAGTDYDRLTVTADVNIGNASLEGTRDPAFVPNIGQQFTILNTTGAGNTITGQFQQGTSVVIGGRLFSITYTSTSVILTAQQSTYTWDGGDTTNNWSSGQNWLNDASPVPGQADKIVFPAGVTDLIAQNDLPNGSGFHSLTIIGNGYGITDGVSAGTISLTNGILENAPAGRGSGVSANITLAQAQTFTGNGLGNGSAPTFFGLQFVNSTINLNGFPLTIDGTGRQIYSSAITGAGGIIKNGVGGVRVDGTNTFTGGVQINNGVFEVSSAMPTSVTLNGGTLAGSGTTGPVTGSGGIAPGALAGTSFNTFGTLNINGNVNLGPGSTLFEQLGGASITHDVLNITGSVNLGAGVNSLNGSILNGFVPAPGQQFTIIQATQGVTGTFVQGNSITFGGTTFNIIYNANSVVLAVAGPTAGGVEVSGRVVNLEGRGIRNAKIALVDSHGVAYVKLVGQFGEFKFEDIPSGETYIVTVSSRRYQFAPQLLQVFDNVTDLVFVPLE